MGVAQCYECNRGIVQPTCSKMEGSSVYHSGKDYLDKFSPLSYLNTYVDIEGRRHMLNCYHKAFSALPRDITILDYGSGPSIVGAISAAAKASSIVLSDYSPANRQCVRDWLENKPGAFDWDPHFSFVVKELEGGSDEDVLKRKQDVRRLVNEIAHCDLTQDPPIEEKYNKLYDIVISSFVLESVATSYEDYLSMMHRITKLINPGGTLLLYGIENNDSYTVGDFIFKDFPVSSERVITTMNCCGFGNIHVDKETVTFSNQTVKHLMFFQALLES